MREEILSLAEGQKRLEKKLDRVLELLTGTPGEPLEFDPHPLTTAMRKMHDDARRRK